MLEIELSLQMPLETAWEMDPTPIDIDRDDACEAPVPVPTRIHTHVQPFVQVSGQDADVFVFGTLHCALLQWTFVVERCVRWWIGPSAVYGPVSVVMELTLLDLSM